MIKHRLDRCAVVDTFFRFPLHSWNLRSWVQTSCTGSRFFALIFYISCGAEGLGCRTNSTNGTVKNPESPEQSNSRLRDSEQPLSQYFNDSDVVCWYLRSLLVVPHKNIGRGYQQNQHQRNKRHGTASLIWYWTYFNKLFAIKECHLRENE